MTIIDFCEFHRPTGPQGRGRGTGATCPVVICHVCFSILDFNNCRNVSARLEACYFNSIGIHDENHIFLLIPQAHRSTGMGAGDHGVGGLASPEHISPLVARKGGLWDNERT